MNGATRDRPQQRNREARGVFLSLDVASAVSLHRQIYSGVRDAIVNGTLAGGARLRSTRALATDLRVSRNTVLTAIDQLLAEGYLETRAGSGTYVTTALPQYLASPLRDAGTRQRAVARTRVSQRGESLAALGARGSAYESRTFRPGVPDLERFPRELWARLAARNWRRASRRMLGYDDPAGYAPLRAAIARYVVGARGVRCTSDQVIVVTGSQQALHLAAHVLLDPGDRAWTEDPGYPGARTALASAGAHVVPVRVDHEGLVLDRRRVRSTPPRLVYVSPSHQFPLGVTMSLARRLELLGVAQSCGAWIVEDDYDSEYRYESRPIAALQGLDASGHVVYIGTFSKVLAPALRLGYLIVPSALVGAMTSARSLVDRESPTVDQATLADFIIEGHFDRHIARMRRVYAARRAALAGAAHRYAAGILDLQPTDAGLHVVAWLPRGIDDRQAARRASVVGVAVTPLSAFSMKPLTRHGLVLSYAGSTPEEIDDAVRRLAGTLRQMTRQRRSPAGE